MTIKVARLNDDWMALALAESEETRMNPDGSNSVHRIQRIRVRRSGIEWDEETDLGEAKQFKGAPYILYAGGMTRVGVMRERAARRRGEKPFAERVGLDELDLLEPYRQYMTELREQKAHRSVFGAAIAKQRS